MSLIHLAACTRTSAQVFDPMFTPSQLVIIALACTSSTLWLARPAGEVAVQQPIISGGCVCQPSGFTFAAFGAACGVAGLLLGWIAHSLAALIAASSRRQTRAAPQVSAAGVGRLQGYKLAVPTPSDASL